MRRRFSPVKTTISAHLTRPVSCNPTIGDQYIKLNVGPIIILGGAPVNSVGLNAY